MYRVMVSSVVLVWMLPGTGCQEQSQRLNAPPQGATDNPAALQEQLTYMNDNALLSDMSFGDAHFVPHTAELNGLGVRRLNRYAALLQQYGGMLRYDTPMSDEDELVVARMAHAVEYLQLAGLDSSRFEIELADPGGLGMRSEEAIQARKAAESPGASGSSGSSLFGR
ncbi:MAG: hypothetical protein O7D32_05290 [bacterium]|nr:hypothetical protein [bacterium]